MQIFARGVFDTYGLRFDKSLILFTLRINHMRNNDNDNTRTYS